MSTVTRPHPKQAASNRRIITLCVGSVGPTLMLQTGLLLGGVLVTMHRRQSGRSLIDANVGASVDPHSVTELRLERHVLIREDHTR
jgi:hypothetical protein